MVSCAIVYILEIFPLTLIVAKSGVEFWILKQTTPCPVYATISAITTIRKKEEIIENEPIEPKGFHLFAYFIKGFFLNIINVGTFLFWLGLLVSIAPTLELETSRIIVFFSTVMLGYLILGFVKIVLAKQLSKTLTPSVIYKIRLSVCVLLVVFGIYFIYQGVYAPEPDVLLPSINQWK